MAKQNPRNVFWTAEIDPLTLPALQLLAKRLGFIKEVPGEAECKPSASAMLDALAEAFYRDQTGTMYVLKVIGVKPDGVATFQYTDTEEDVGLPEER